LKNAYRLANDHDELGLANYLQDRIDAHKKHGWMIRSTGMLGIVIHSSEPSSST
jgi:DNA-binding ferritin-like protein